MSPLESRLADFVTPLLADALGRLAAGGINAVRGVARGRAGARWSVAHEMTPEGDVTGVRILFQASDLKVSVLASVDGPREEVLPRLVERVVRTELRMLRDQLSFLPLSVEDVDEVRRLAEVDEVMSA